MSRPIGTSIQRAPARCGDMALTRVDPTGMNRLCFLTVLALANAVHAKCPNGTVAGAGPYDCFLFRLTPATWIDAEIDCSSRGGNLASVSSESANIVLSKEARLNCAREFWLGGWLTSDAPGLWSWTDGSRFSSFANWEKGHPILLAGYCAAVNVTDGRWHSRFCSEKMPYVCQLSSAQKTVPKVEARSGPNIPRNPLELSKAPVVPDDVPGPARCPPEWTYVAAQGKGLRVVPVSDFWINQRARCRELGGDLVSLHSSESNYATVEFAREAAGVADNVCHAFAIGLFHTRWTGGTMWSEWRWTDGSPFDGYSNLDSVYLTNPHGTATDGPGARMIVCGLDVGYVFVDEWNKDVKNGYWDAVDDPALMAICQLSA